MQIVQQPSPNFSSRQGNVPDIIVNHIAEGTYEGTISWLRNSKSGVSAHFVVSKDGDITQLVALDRSAWANGTSNNGTTAHSLATNHYVKERKVNANWYTISIEYEGYYKVNHGALTTKQLTASIWLHKYIISEVQRLYGVTIPLDRNHIIGHSEINPKTKPNCPGEKFQFDSIISSIIGEHSSPVHLKELVLIDEPLYTSSTAVEPATTISGTYYLYDDKKFNGRVRITNRMDRIGKLPTNKNITGYIIAPKIIHHAGMKVELKNAPLFISCINNVRARNISGTYYLYDGKLMRGRYRIVKSKDHVNGDIKNVIGYINRSDV